MPYYELSAERTTECQETAKILMLSKYLTNILYKDGIVSEDEKEIVQFGLESIEGNLLSIVLTLIVGSCFQRFYDAMLLWVLLFLLRKNAGGFHASTKLRCCIVSIVQLAISFLIFSSFFVQVYFMEYVSR